MKNMKAIAASKSEFNASDLMKAAVADFHDEICGLEEEFSQKFNYAAIDADGSMYVFVSMPKFDDGYLPIWLPGPESTFACVDTMQIAEMSLDLGINNETSPFLIVGI